LVIVGAIAMGDRQSIEEVVAALRAEHPELEAVAAAASEPVYLVGGVVRDRLLGRGRADVDVVVVGDAGALARALSAAPVAEHERFATAKVAIEGHEVDIAQARTETYPEPGALPEVAPAADIEEDLGRRDFTINAMAIPLAGEPRLVDPHGGRDDLDRGLLRVLHGGSFVDDPTRAVRAARYASRFGFALEEETERLAREADLSTVSEDRRRAELLRLAGEPTAIRGLELLVDWGVVKAMPGGIRLAGEVAELLATDPWQGEAPLAPAVLAAALEPAGAEAVLAAAAPARPSEGVELARRHSPIELVLARALGGAWLDDYIAEWRSVRLEIDGDDLIAAGVPEGPAIGRGLDAALRAKLDGDVEGREGELATALAAAGKA
jgi:tRNA nucleotidyltransferase (CCA-adding enzyme)